MAVITKLPGLDIISGFRGVLDYYIYYMSCDREVAGKGIICVRTWPKKAIYERSPAELATQLPFTAASRLWSSLSPEIQESYRKMTGRGGLNGRDIFSKSYISGIYRYPHTPTP